MDLLSPWFLAGGLTVALPLWLHLMRRSNPVRIPFSSLMFFRERTETTIRERRLRYLLLLAARLALLLLLAVAFAGPVWQRPPTALGGRVPRLHFICVDTSLSMQFGSRWERALAVAESVVGSLQDGDRAQIMANGPSVRMLTSATFDRSELRRALAGLSPSQARNSYGDAVEAVRNLVVGERTPASLHLISDLQRSSMPTRFQDLVLPDGMELVVHDVGGEDADNWAIDTVRGSTRVYGRERPGLEVTVASYADRPISRTVYLSIDGTRIAGSSREVPARGRASFRFEIGNPPRGFSRAEFRLEPGDGLAPDDVRRVALDNTDPEQLLFVSQDPRGRDLLYYRAALDASEAMNYVLEGVSPGATARLDPGRYAVVVLSDVAGLPSAFASRLGAWVQAGGAVLIALGPGSVLERRVVLTGHEVEQPRASERGGARFHLAGEADVSHPVVRATEGLRPVKFFLYARLKVGEGDEVPLRLANGDPLLVEHAMGSGRVLILASSLDNVWNDLPVTPMLVPFVSETARYLRDSDTSRGAALLGSVLELGRRRGTGSSVQVVDPQGQRVLSLEDSVTREAVPLESVGFYEVRSEGRSALLGVNPDPRESDLLRIEPRTLELWRDTAIADPGPAADAAGDEAPPPVPPWNVWRLVVAFLLAAVLLESVVANRHLDAARGE